MATKKASKSKAPEKTQDVGNIIAARVRSNELSTTDVKNVQRFLGDIEKTLAVFRREVIQGW
jgi:hypothetical protein